MQTSQLLAGIKTWLGRLIRQCRRTYGKQVNRLHEQRKTRREIDVELRRRADGGTGTPLPDFLIIGAPKCATSWLRLALARQSNVIMADDEIEYFTSHLDRPLQWYLAHFEALLAAEREKKRISHNLKLIVGEKSAGYCGFPFPAFAWSIGCFPMRA